MIDSKIPGPQIAYTDLVDYLTDTKEDEFDAFPLRPSSAGKCSKALAMELVEWQGRASFPKEKKAPNVKRLLSLGSSVEYHVIKNFDQLQKASKDFKIRYKQQTLVLFQIPGGPLIEGSTDLWIMNRENNRGGILDVKSTKEKWSGSYKSDWDERIEKFNEMSSLTRISDQGWYAKDLRAFLNEFDDDFKKDNFLQLNAYACSPFAKEHGVDHASIIYYSKNTSNYIEVRFAPDEGLFTELQQKFANIWNLAQSNTPEQLAAMPCEFLPGTIKNAFCACHTYSGHDPKEAMNKWFKTFPPKKWPTDVEKIQSKRIEGAFNEYEGLLGLQQRLEHVEQEIIKELTSNNVTKARLPNGHVYEVKAYKSGGISNGPRVALKRSKA
jgi:hypothetical protein